MVKCYFLFFHLVCVGSAEVTTALEFYMLLHILRFSVACKGAILDFYFRLVVANSHKTGCVSYL